MSERGMSVFAGTGVLVGDVNHVYSEPARLAALCHAHQVGYLAVKLVEGARLANGLTGPLGPWVRTVRDQGNVQVAGWGQHHADQSASEQANLVSAAVSKHQLAGYIAVIEAGYYYDGDSRGWGSQHTGEQWRAWEPAFQLLEGLRDQLGDTLPLAVCLTPQKDYPYGLFAAADVDLFVELYDGQAKRLLSAGMKYGATVMLAVDAGILSTRVHPCLAPSQQAPEALRDRLWFCAEIMQGPDWEALG